MSLEGDLSIRRLHGAELDDQAIAEIIDLIAEAAPGRKALAQTTLLRMAARGPLLVARRPCGRDPEIVAVAGLFPDGESATALIAIHPSYRSPSLRRRMARQLPALAKSFSLFRASERPPLGLPRSTAA
jgi:hypothetical protein